MGDCTLGTDENFSYDTSLNAYYATQGADYFFQNVRSILEADDLSIINMEGPLTTSTTRGSDQFDFKGDPSFVDILTDSSIEAANVANNHSHDYGDQGFTDTKETLENAGITTFGYDDTSIVTVKGVNVGLVGIYELYDHLERTRQLKDNIAKVKADGADVVIVVFHWGNEKDTVPDSNQTTLAHTAIDYGADLVVGHHPHVLQGIEEYHGKYIAYSLGNFCFGGNSNPSDTDTIIFQQTFTLKNGEVLTDDNINIIPCSISSVSGYNNYQPTPAQDSEADRILEKLKERSEAIGSYLTFW
jgi:poly-gamma-glutamate synthesis protein (capsule biosynthesis protein)